MGIISDGVDQVDNARRAFTLALSERGGTDIDETVEAVATGADPGVDIPTAPFFERAEVNQVPEEMYVRHDMELIQEAAKRASSGMNVGLLSPYGTGKTTFREIFLREFGNRDDWVIAHLENPRDYTPRQLYGLVIQIAGEAGYTVDPTNYEQVRNGVPWSTTDAEQAVKEVSQKAEADQTTLALLVDEMEYMPEKLYTPLKEIGDARVSLLLVGRPQVREQLREEWSAFDSRVDFLSRGIKPFEPQHIEEYAARGLAFIADDEYDPDAHQFADLGDRQDLFTAGAIEAISERTEGNQRLVQKVLANVYQDAAEEWVGAGCPPIDDYHINREQVQRTLDALSDVSQVPDEAV